MDPAPPPADLETMNLLIVMHNYMQQVNPEPVGVQAHIDELTAEKNGLVQQMNNLNRLPIEDFGHMEVWASRVAMINIRLQELNSQMALFRDRNGRIRATFVNVLLGTNLLEVNNVETAELARSLFDDYGWRGTVCYQVEENDEILGRIHNVLVGMPRRIVVREEGAPLMWGNVQVL